MAKIDLKFSKHITNVYIAFNADSVFQTYCRQIAIFRYSLRFFLLVAVVVRMIRGKVSASMQQSNKDRTEQQK